MLPMTLPLQLGDALAGREQGKCKNFRVFIGQPSGLRFGQLPAQRGFNQSLRRSGLRLPWLHDGLHTSARTTAQTTYFNIYRPCLALQTADLLLRKKLLQDGFTRMQYSVYLRHCASRENADVHIQRAEANVPDDGEVRVLTITDKQYERMHVFWGKRRKPPENPPRQLELF